MITPRAFEKIIQHFNEIDKAVSKRTTRKRPWSEIALTSLLCDLMDQETQEDEKLSYTIKDLQNDLCQDDNLIDINLAIESIEFPTKYERYLSQSDIGIRIIFENKIEPNLSWIHPYFLQAKRLISNRSGTEKYPENSKFDSIDKDQKKRIEIVNKFLKGTYIKYLLYCPRPEQLSEKIRTKLTYLRNKSLVNEIFDYTKGLKIHSEFIENGDSIKSGMFITEPNNTNLNFGQVHSNILQSVTPFSWFIAQNFLHNQLPGASISENSGYTLNDEGNRIINGVFNGDEKCIDELIQGISAELNDDFPSNYDILPKSVLDIKITLGPNLNENDILKVD